MTPKTLLLAPLMLILSLAACDEETSGVADAAPPDLAAGVEGGVDRGVPDGPVADASGGDLGPAVDLAAPDAAPADQGLADFPPGCNATKIGFTQANSKKYELYELCFPSGDMVTEALLKKIDSNLQCSHSAGGIAAKCPAGTWRCLAALQLNYPAKDIKNGHWQSICAISWIKAVSKMAGGWYI